MQLFAMRGHWVFRNVNLLHLKCIFNLYVKLIFFVSPVYVLPACWSVRSRGDFTVEKLPTGLGCTQGPFVWHQCALLLWILSSTPGRKHLNFQQYIFSLFFKISSIASQMESNHNEHVLQRRVDFFLRYYVIKWPYWNYISTVDFNSKL